MTEPPQEQPDFQPPGWQPPQPAPPPPQQGQAWTAPPPPPRGGRGSIWLGIGIAFGTVLAWWGLSAAVPSDHPLASMLNNLIPVLPFGLMLAGIVLAAIPRTTRTGAGVLIGIGAGILMLGGLCIALLIGYNG